MHRRSRRRPAQLDETEQTRPIRVRIDDALDALGRGTIRNGYLIMALQWLALNRERLPELLHEA